MSVSRLRKEYIAIALLAALSLSLGAATLHYYGQAAKQDRTGEALTQGAALMHLKIGLRTVARQLDEVLAGERELSDLPRIRQELFAAQRFASLVPWESFARLGGALGLAQLDLETGGESLTEQERLRIAQVQELAAVVYDLLPERAMYISPDMPWDEETLLAMNEAVQSFMNEPHRRMR